ncbi:hypothetical protein Hanom_Chr07g00631291 [Helianthus anomalus]
MCSLLYLHRVDYVQKLLFAYCLFFERRFIKKTNRPHPPPPPPTVHVPRPPPSVYFRSLYVWSISSSIDVCRCGPQTADILPLKKQTAPKLPPHTTTTTTHRPRLPPSVYFRSLCMLKKQTTFFLKTAEVWSTSSSTDVCRCGPQTAGILPLKKQTAPKLRTEVDL